jgi:hypothetical protein
MKDYNTTISSLVEKSTPVSYLTYVEAASTTAAANWSNKSAITHFYNKPGRGPGTLEVLKAYKKAWEKMGANVVVWATFNSGEPQYVAVRRYKDGFKDLDAGGSTLRQAFEEANGAGSLDKALEEINRCVDHTVGELIEFIPPPAAK